MMANPQIYPAGPGQQVSQVVRRPMTPEELQLPGRFYKGLQNGLRGLSFFCLILFIFSTFILPSMMFDAVTYDSLSIVLTMFMVAFGLVAIGMSVNTVVVRKRIAQALAEGTVVEVFGPAYRAGAMRKGQGWTVGPISVLPTRGLDHLIVEGAPTRVLCIPRLKAALAVNNVGLSKGAKIMCPPNLDGMAVPLGMPPVQPRYQEYPIYAPSPPQATPSPSQDEELPPPPPPID